MEKHVPMLVFWIANVIAFRVSSSSSSGSQNRTQSALGDPGMRRDGLRVAFEGWNFCNEVGQEAPDMGSPRAADCFDVVKPSNGSSKGDYTLLHKVNQEDNNLGIGQLLPGITSSALTDPDLYAPQKELYLANLCKVSQPQDPHPWHFWTIMLKNGNFDPNSNPCPRNGQRSGHPSRAPEKGKFPCFGRGCMNQPALRHDPTKVTGDGYLKGRFSGSYDLGRKVADGGEGEGGSSYFEVRWEKKIGGNESWVFRHKLRSSEKYPWLMLYLRADAAFGFSGGYRYESRGMLKVLPESPNFKVKLHLEVKQGGGPKSQFYLIDIGSCWKNNGEPCNGDTRTDVTRYSEMIINPETPVWCTPSNSRACPPYHITPNDTKIYRSDTARFPYDAYHYYCGPGNAKFMEQPADACDPYSNPQPQEILQLRPHPVWAEYGYPTRPGQGWVGDPTTWELDVGGLSSRLYFYQDPDTPPARRIWTSIDAGTEIFESKGEEIAEWTVSDFDVILTS